MLSLTAAVAAVAASVDRGRMPGAVQYFAFVGTVVTSLLSLLELPSPLPLTIAASSSLALALRSLLFEVYLALRLSFFAWPTFSPVHHLPAELQVC